MAAVDRRDYERPVHGRPGSNMVTADLFRKYDTLEKFANADLKELEQDIHSTGFYHMKAKKYYRLLPRPGGQARQRGAADH